MIHNTVAPSEQSAMMSSHRPQLPDQPGSKLDKAQLRGVQLCTLGGNTDLDHVQL